MDEVLFLLLLTAVMLVSGIPIAAILTHHQRKMAEIIHRTRGSADQIELATLRAEVAALRERIHEQSLQLDRTATAVERLSNQALTAPAQELRTRGGSDALEPPRAGA